MQLREFTKTDWYGLAGAERGPNGELPLVAYNEGNCVVVDRNGIYVQLHDGNRENDTHYQYATNFMMAKQIAQSLPTVLTHEQLIGLGFEKI